MTNKKNMNKSIIESELYNNKILSIQQKDHMDIYTKLVHANSFRNNEIKNVLVYLPSDLLIDEAKESLVDRTNEDKSLRKLWDIGFEEIELFEEDNTLSEIVSQKMNSYNQGSLVGSLNKDSSIIKQLLDAQEQGQTMDDTIMNQITQFIDSSSLLLRQYQDQIIEMIEQSMYYPFSGLALTFYEEKDENYIEGDEVVLSNRWIPITPFTFDSDITTTKIDDAEWVVITERVSYNTFAERLRKGEYSECDYNSDDSYIRDRWNQESSYQFATKSFVEQAVSKNSTLRMSAFQTKIKNKNKKDSDDSEDFNLYGVIEYMYKKTENGSYTQYTFLNGNMISQLGIDERIDMLPVVLFSEEGNIRNNIRFQGNLGFKLLPSQKTILKINAMKEAGTQEASPFINITYVDAETTVEKQNEVQQIDTVGNALTNITLYSDNPVSANNSSRFVDGGTFYGNYLKMWDEQVMQVKAHMKEAAGITEFSQGTASHSIASQSGLNQMAITGLKNEYDVVKSHANTIKFFITLLGFVELQTIAKSMEEDDKYGLDEKEDTLRDIVTQFNDILSLELETAYQKEFTQSLVQNLIVPLAAQSGNIASILPMLKELPVTEAFKEGVDAMGAKIQEQIDQKKQDEMDMQQQEQQNQVQTSQAGDSGAAKKVSQKVGSKASSKSTKTSETKKSTRASKKPSKDASK